MAIVMEKKDSMLLCHASSMCFRVDAKTTLTAKAIFNVATPFRMDSEASNVADVMEGKERRRKRRHNKIATDNVDILTNSSSKMDMQWALERLSELREACEERQVLNSKPDSETIRANNGQLRSLVRSLNSFDVDLTSFAPLEGHNGSKEYSKIISLNCTDFLVPPLSHFYLDTIEHRLPMMVEGGHKYNVVLLDPPWDNRHVRRERSKDLQINNGSIESGKLRRGYKMQKDLDEMFESLRYIKDMLDTDQSMVIVWATPNQRIMEAVEKWLGKFHFDRIVKWIWMKTTLSGEPVVDKFPHKLSHECIYIGSKGRDFDLLPLKLCLCSTPSGFHSHKPPLDNVLRKFVRYWEKKKCLEVFGRYLSPNWTTVGDQCLLFQNTLYYQRNQEAQTSFERQVIPK